MGNLIDEVLVFGEAITMNELEMIGAYYGITDESKLADKAIAYLPLDKKIKNKIDSDIVTTRGKSPNFDAGFNGAALSTGESGYITLGETWKPGTNSFSASMWFKGVSTSGQVCLLANQSWGPEDMGFVFVWYQHQDNVRGVFNFNGVKQVYNFNVPDDYLNRWMYITIVVDRENHQVKMSLDFDDFIVYDLHEAYRGASFDSYNYEGGYLGDGRQSEHVWTTYRPVAIGNDGVGGRSVPMGNLIDEVLVFNSALTMDDLALIDAYYGYEQPKAEEPEETTPRLTVDKTTYAVGESIMVTAVGSGTDWVGINTKAEADNGAGSAFWWYIESVSGQAFDLLSVADGSGNTCTLPAGVYTIRLVANDAGFGSEENWIDVVEITVQ
jgi:hypothetical protein